MSTSGEQNTSHEHSEHVNYATEHAREVQNPAIPDGQGVPNSTLPSASVPSPTGSGPVVQRPPFHIYIFEKIIAFFHKYKTHIATAIISVVVPVVAIFVFRSVIFSDPKQVASIHQSCEPFQPLASKYPNTNDMLWFTLDVGVGRAVKDPGEPATFIFLYNSDSIGQFLSLMDDVIRTTNKCFGNGGAIWRTSDDFKSFLMTQDHRAVLERYREELQEQGVLVVRDLDRVPPNAAQVFFTICDSYEPLVPKAAIFFTIDISQRAANQSQQQSPTEIAERILKDLWRKELQPNELNPLVVRLTENVFMID